MTSLRDYLPIPNFGEILPNLLPDDDLPRHKYNRGLATRLFSLGFLSAIGLEILQSAMNYDLSAVFSLSVLLIVFAIILFLHSDHHAKDFQQHEKEEREEYVKNKRAKRKKNEEAAGIMSDSRATLQERGFEQLQYADEDFELEIGTAETKELEYEE